MYPRRARRSNHVLSLLLSSVIIVGFVNLFFLFTAQTAAASSPHVDRMVLNSQIDPASLRFLTKAITTAENDGAQALVVEIDTPGGDLQSMESMKQAELTSTVPIISFVSPTGAHAASAGAFITLAAHIAAMAPTTSIGASSPVTSSGGDIESTLKAKIINTLVADIRTIQNRYHRKGVDPAVKMVKEAASYPQEEAVRLNIVDLGASNLTELLKNVDGRLVTLDSGRTVTLKTAGVRVQPIDADALDSLYNFLLNPNVVFLLLVIAIIGIYVEISHPGVILPGVAGGIALLLFLFAAGTLSPNWTGLALMGLAFVLLVLDVRLPTHGVLTLGALISLILGAFIFFNSGGNGPYDKQQVNPLVIYSMAGVIALLSFGLITVIVRVQRRPVTTGREGMIGMKAIAITPLVPEGRVSYNGENWAAILDDPLDSVDPGSEVRIVAIEGLRLHVQPIHSQPFVDKSAYLKPR